MPNVAQNLRPEEAPVPLLKTEPLPFDPAQLCAPLGNQVLARLPRTEFKRLQPHLQPAWLLGGEKIRGDAGNRFAIFPVQAVLALQNPHADGCAVSYATVGREGCVGSEFIVADAPDLHATAAIGGLAYLLPAQQLIAECEAQGELARLLVAQGNSLLAQAAVLCACNRRHTLEQQLSSWLMLMLDRSQGNELIVTQEMIATLLGVRREGVTEAAGRLQKAGLIEYRRGHIYILKRDCLAARACECYSMVRKQLGRHFAR
jgi:CRP-like cAMP-binding protein